MTSVEGAPTLRHELIGPPGAPVVVVLGGVSASRHVTQTAANPKPGWWDAQVGPGRAIDTNVFRVLGVDYLDGGRQPDGRPARVVTTHDQATALAALLDSLGIGFVRAVIGASYGGMVGLAFAERYSARVEELVVISAAHESHPMSTGLRALQRKVVELGLDHGAADAALAIARGIAMTTYRTAREFAERFENTPTFNVDTEVSFEVERYLLNRGADFAAKFRPEYFLALSLSSDLHRVDPAAVRTPTTIIAAEGDTLVPEEQTRDLTARLGAPARFELVPTIYGHDAFLKEAAKFSRLLSSVLSPNVTP
jgi:homoserine O-acetyltransferase/O-succinyltransferase